jgi:hypothetical protein
LNTLFAAGTAPGLEGLAGSGDGLVDIGFRAHRNHCTGLLVGRVDDLQFARGFRRHPFAIDIEIRLAKHETPLVGT